MKTVTKIGVVAGGYVGAVVIAVAVVATYVAFTAGPDRIASSGMYAFGDSLLFLAIFGMAAVPATCAALYFLRPHRLFWHIFSLAASITALSVLAALATVAWSALAVLRIIAAPLFALLFLLSGVFAPNRSTRIALLVATFVEASAFGAVVLTLLSKAVR